MPKAARGTKRHCRHCGARFYDLARDPIVCPLCHAKYELEAHALRGGPAARSEPEKVVAAAAVVGAVIDMENAEAPSDAEVGVEDEDLPDLGEAQEEIPEEEGANVFLEEEEEDGSDVSGFIGGPLDTDEER